MGRKNVSRPQALKDRSMDRVRMVQDLRRSSASEPVPSGRTYARNDYKRAVQRRGWDA